MIFQGNAELYSILQVSANMSVKIAAARRCLPLLHRCAVTWLTCVILWQIEIFLNISASLVVTLTANVNRNSCFVLVTSQFPFCSFLLIIFTCTFCDATQRNGVSRTFDILVDYERSSLASRLNYVIYTFLDDLSSRCQVGLFLKIKSSNEVVSNLNFYVTPLKSSSFCTVCFLNERSCKRRHKLYCWLAILLVFETVSGSRPLYRNRELAMYKIKSICYSAGWYFKLFPLSSFVLLQYNFCTKLYR